MSRVASLVLASLTACIGGGCNSDAGEPDLDGDYVADATDNCSYVGNADQRDHDGDGRGDACDRCPHLASTTDRDDDGDGVGDDCDPRPLQDGDSIAKWEGFYDDDSIATWIGQGAWSVADGALTQSDPGFVNAHLMPPPWFSVARPAVTIGARIVSLGPEPLGPDGIALYTLTSYDKLFPKHPPAPSNPTPTYMCRIGRSSTQPEDDAVDVGVFSLSDLRPGGYASSIWLGTWAAGSNLRLTHAVIGGATRGGTHHCTATQDATTVNMTGVYGATAGTNVALAVHLMAVSFDYVFIVSVGT